MHSLIKRCFAEFLGTFFLLFIGVGSLIFTSSNLGIVASSLCFGIIFILLYYFLNQISGCHLNPVVSLACAIIKKISVKECLMYSLFQLIACIVSTILLFALLLCSGEIITLISNFTACVGYDNFSPLKISLPVALIVEILITAVFVFAFLFFQNKFKKANLSGIGIGLVYVILCLIGSNLTGACINPLRALCPALITFIFASFTPIIQFFVFLLATYIGAIFAVIVYSLIFKLNIKPVKQTDESKKIKQMEKIKKIKMKKDKKSKVKNKSKTSK